MENGYNLDWKQGKEGMNHLVDGNSGRVFRLDSGFVGVNVGTEAQGISDIVNGSDPAISVSQTIRSNNLSQSISLLSPEGAASRVVFIIPEVIVTSNLKSDVMQ